MTDKENVYYTIGKAEGVICALYGFARDVNPQICSNVEPDKNGKLGDVVGDTLDALAELPDYIEAVNHGNKLPEIEDIHMVGEYLSIVNLYLDAHREMMVSVENKPDGGQKIMIFP